MPKTLTEAQVDALLAAPDVDTPLGLRDRTMLELMYASGLRVSELVDAQERAPEPERRRAARDRQGRKERLVPFGEEARAWIERYLRRGARRDPGRRRRATRCSSPRAAAA